MILSSHSYSALATDEHSAFVVTKATIKTEQNGMIRLSALTNGIIPAIPNEFVNSNAAVGIAWIDFDLGKALVATIHPNHGNIQNQNLDSWHIHTITFVPDHKSNYCIKSIDSSPVAAISIKENKIDVNMKRVDLPFEMKGFDAGHGLVITPEPRCLGINLGVKILES